MKKFLYLLFMFFFVSCGGENQSAIDDFFGTGNEDEDATGAITFSTNEFREAVANDGSIENTITVNLNGRIFDGAVGEEFVGSKLIVTNLPAGLTISCQYVNDKELLVSVTGNANDHANIDDVNNVSFNFDDSAFNIADDIANKESLLAVNYRDPYALSYDKTIINESGSNDGSFVEAFNVTVNDLEFSGNNGEDFVGNGKITITNAPAGTTGTATKIGPNIIAISLSGNATNNATTDDISNLTVIFNSPAFPTGVSAGVVANTTRNDLGVNFFDPALITYLPLSETFSEAVSNVGFINNQLTINVNEDTFSGNIGENYIANGKVVVSNLPTGLSAQVVKLTNNDVSVTLNGQAINHADANDISNLTINFSANAFNFNTNIANVVNAQKNDISVDFINPYTLSFDTKSFIEDGANDGSVNTVSTGTLSGTTFVGSIGDELVGLGRVAIANVPPGLTVSVLKSSANTVSVSLNGNALNHESVNNLNNISINFLDSAFTSGAALGVDGASNTDFSIQFRDPVSISYSGSTFFESTSNDGTISNFIDINLSNDIFTGVNGENFLGNGKASISPSPVASGLTAVLERISDTQARLRLNGTAVASDIDISGITLTFNPSAFVTSTSIANINGAIKNNFVIDYIDVLTYASTSVAERALNDGQIDQTIALTLTGTTFTGTNGDNLVGDGKVIVTNLPSGLNAVITRNSNQNATLSFSGAAGTHTSSEDVSNVTIIFQGSAFASNNASNVTNSTISNFTISFLDPVSVSYSSNVFIESLANDGSIDNTIILTVSGDTFTGTNGENYIGGGKVTLTPAIPPGLTATLTRTSSTTLEFALSGNAATHEIDQGPFTLTLDDTAFTINTNTTNIVDASRNDIMINYNDSLAYSTTAFSERALNDGIIDTTSVISLTGTTFTGNNGDDFVADSKVTITNLPIGHTASLIRNSATQLVMSITGTAASHTSSDDISNLTITFANNAFINNSAASVGNSVVNNMTISYLDPVSLSFSTDTFNENIVNDGSINNSINIDISNDTFTGNNGDDFIPTKATVTNVPVGLTAELRRISATQVRLSLIGNAASNDIDISNLGLSFNASALTTTTDMTNVQNATKSDIKINYYDLLTYSTKTITERSLNDGIIDQTVNISITGTSFSGLNGDDFNAQGKVVVSNVPTGLTAVLTRNSSSQLTLSFTGVASNNESADSVSNVTISFLDSALNGSTTATLENATVNDIAINFFDSVAISYSADTFNEALANNGSIDNTITLTAVNDSFTGNNGDDFLIDGKATLVNLPAGLSATLVKISSSVLQFNLTGNAIDHGDIHDVSNLSLEIRASALTITTNTTNVLNAIKADLKIDYISPSSLDYDTLAFEESSANNGSVANVINIDIDGLDSFTGLIGDDFITDGKVVVNNIPTGFSATVIKTASKQVRFILSGNALSHEAADSVSNVSIAFNSSALTFNNDISLVGDNSQSAIQVNFRNAATLTYTATALNENAANVGGIDETFDIDLANDTFTGTNGEDLLGTAKAVISNLPAGLSPTLERISSTKVRLSLSGNAVSHALADSVSNLTINFQPAAFSFNTDVNNIANGQRNDLNINFIDPYQVTYSSSTFTETVANTGELSGSSSISVSGTSFAGSLGDNFVSNGMVTVQNLPAGLTAVVQKTAANQVVFTLTGNATNNANINDIANLGLTFQSSAFASGDALGVLDSTKSDFIIDYIDPYSLTWSGTSVNENIQNVGTITETLTITLNGHTFSGTNGDDFLIASRVSLTGVPAGLTATVIRNSSTELELSFTGTATNHANPDDVSNINFTLQNSALTGGAQASDVINFNISNLAIDFLPPYTLSANGFSFDEDGANDGSVSDTITYTLVGTTFAGINGRDLVTDGHVAMTNVPAGLTAVVTKIDDNNVTLSFTGNALNNEVSDNTANTDIDFLAGAFTSNNENGVVPNNFTGLSFSWDDPPSLSYSPTILVEANSNIGATNTSVSIFAANKRYDGILGENFITSSKVTVSGHPAGLTPVVTYASATQVNLTFTGNATNHADANDIATGVSVSFNNSAFEGGNAAQVVNGTFTGLGFDFIDPYQLSYATDTFVESSLNNGGIANTVAITVAGTLFTGSVGEEYIGASKAVVNNVPAGLTATVTKLSTSLVEVALTGTASNHESADSISNLEVQFLDTAFASGAAAGVNDSTKSDININYNNTATVNYASSTFNEEIGNIGAIDNSISITVSEDTFTGPNGENYISTAKVTAANVPVGLIPQVVKVNDTTLSFSLTGNALAHENVHDISNVTLSFAGSAFSFNSNPASINNSTKNDFAIDYIDAYQLSYASSTFTEATTNNGAIGNSIALTLTGTTFTGSNGDNFVADGKVTVSNIPAGLTAIINRDSGTQVTLSFTGVATSHANSNDISNLTVIFADSAFTSGRSAGVDGHSKSDIAVDFNDPPFLTYLASTFSEAASNIGAVGSTVDITLTNATFSGSDLDIYTNGVEASFSNVPSGLTPRLQKIDSTTVRLSFTGNASSHASGDSISNFGISFNNAAFNTVAAANISNTAKNDYSISFINPYSISYSGNTFTESVSNIGAISSSVDITLVGTTFVGANGLVYTNGTDASFLNLPSGLTPRLEKINDTTIRLTLTGAATSHALANSITNFGISLLDPIFTSGAAAGVSNNTKIDFNINFIDPYTITYSLPGFQEANSNNGQIGTTVDVDLVGTSFSGVNSSNYTPGTQYSVANVPAGLTAVVFKVSNTKLRIFFTGNASNHEDVNDISNFTISFNDSAFISGAAAGVLNNSKSDFIIDYISAATLAYSGATFNEALSNTGSISNTLTITLSNDSFSGLNGENYVSNSKVSVANVPSGLTATVTKTSNTTVDFTLTGNAAANLNANDIANLTLTFNASAFDFNTDASTVTGFSRNDINVDFIDQYSLAYVPGTFTEAALNDGSIGNSVVVTLTGSGFTTTSTDFISEGKVTVSNIPSGLAAAVVRDSSSQVTVSLTGNAANNLNSNDISNLTITFADTAFTTGAALGVDNSTKGDLVVDFADQPSIVYAASTFNESAANVGGVTDTVLINLTGATFSGVNGAFYTALNQFSVSNVPSGLTAQVQKISNTQVALSFTGSASSHAVANNVSNIGITFLDNAFNVIAASNVDNNSKSDFVLNFRDPYTLAYSASSFSEAVSNTGAISNSILITVSGTTFTGVNGANYTNTVEYSFSNLPTGLGVQVQKVSSNQLSLSFTGQASNHALTDSITNFTLSLLNNAFTSGDANGVNDTTKADFAINFINPYTIAYSGSTFNEAGSNDGSISNSLDLDLTGTTYTGSNGSTYSLGTEYSVANVPSGLSFVVTKINDTKLRITLSGTASSNDNTDDISNLTFTLNNSAFTSGAASGVIPSSRSDLIVDFVDNASLAYSSGTFNEAASNIGAISNTLTVTLSNDIFTGLNGENFVSSSKVSVTNLPSGLSASVTKTSDTTVNITLNGAASSNLNIHDISNLTVSFNALAFSFNTNVLSISNAIKNDIVVDFIDQYSLAYAPTVFTEGAQNDGSIGNTVVITLTGSNFTTTATNFISEGKVAITNVPTGLTPVIIRDSNTQVTLSLSSNASNHANSNDISNLTVTFADTAFTTGAAGGVDNSSVSNISVDFNDPPSLAYGGSTFSESDANVGAVTDTIDVILTGANFSGADSSFYIASNQFTASNVPSGLALAVQKINSTTVRLSLTGNASSHAIANSITNLGIQFTDNAFNIVSSANILNNSKSDFAINFRDPYTLAYSGSAFSESVSNVGAISTTVNITVSGTTFTGANGANYTNAVEYTTANLPSGLGVQVQKISNTVLQLSFTGAATSNDLADSIANFTTNLLSAAFTSGDASGVNDTTKADFAINFIDPYTITYSAGSFTEDGANDGSITDTIDIDITGTTFTGTNGATYVASTQYTASNIPGGLTLVVTKINSTKLRLSFTGTATANENVNDISNLTINLLDAAFTSGASAGITGSSKNDIAIDFIDGATLAYSTTTFNEAASNIGEVDTTITVTLSNDTFAGLNGENYVSTGKASVSGLPTGLTGVITKTSNTTVDVTITGGALFHANADDLSTVGVTFASSAFDFNTNAASVTNSSRSDLTIDFIDPYVISYSIGGMTEAAANDGSMGNTIVMTLSGGSNFTTTGSDFITEGKVNVTNVPAGLSAVITRDSSTQVTLSLTGNATNNDNSNDISTLSIVFNDTAFTTGRSLGVTGSTRTNLFIDFNDQPNITYAASNLTEDISNTGTIAGSIDIDITNDTFTGTDTDVYNGTKVTVANVPSGLTARIEKISDTKLRLTYTGTASAHELTNNVSNISMTFLNAAFTNVSATNVNNSSKPDFAITFRDPYSIAYSTGTFNEALSNNGAVSSTVDVTIAGTTFTGVNGTPYTLSNQYTVSNEPAGLTTVVTKINDTTLRISFTGTASAHADTDDISNFGITFNDSAFTSGSAAGVNNTTKSDFIIDYLAPANLTYSTLALNESNLNNGTVTETITIDIVNDTFSGAISSDLIGNGDIVVTNLPASFTAVATKTTSTRLVVSLTGSADNHANTNDLSNIDFEFAASAFTNNTVATNVVNYKVSTISINFEDPYIISYGSTSVSEAGTNNGAVTDTITINLVGTTFTGSNGENFAGTKATFSNVPTGLTAVLTKDNNNQLTLSFTGTATPHTDSEDVSNMGITFLDGAFSSGAAAGVDNSSVTNLSVDFNDLASIAYAAGTFNEAVSNIGNITQTITLTLSNDTFTGINGDDFAGNGNATVSNVPAGLTAVLERTSNTTVEMSFTGNASAHANANDVTNVSVVFNAVAFTFNTNASLVTNSSKSDIGINYEDPYSISYSVGSVNEATANDGSVTETIDINLTGTTFTGVNSDNFAGSKAIVSNVPAGLTAVVTRTAAGQVRLSFTGNATNNENTHDVTNVQVAFDDSAFASNAALGVTNSTKSDIGINFNDRPIISYSASTIQEDVSNVGTFSTALVIDLTDELFSAGSFDASKVTITNLPAGLGTNVTRVSDTQVSVSFTGTASPHTTAEDVSNVTVTFLDAAFQNVAAANITGSTNGAITLSFRDPYVLSFSSGTFQESVNNDGTIATSITSTISGTTFSVPAVSMLADSMVAVNNIPSGLTASVVRNSSTQVTISFTGDADNHASVNDISNLEVIFNDNAFASNESDGVSGSTKSDFIVDYLDPASLAYSTATFNENLANDGTINNFIDITISADTFTGNVSDNFAGTKATISNVPSGLTATLIRQSATVVRLILSGPADNHESANDVSNLTVEFLAGAFTNNTIAANVTNYERTDLVIDYIDAYQLAYSVESLDEAIANDGSITATLNIALTGTTFTTGTDFVTESKVLVTNTPATLTPVLTRVDATNLTLSFTGNATVHELANSISNLTLTFQDTAFTTGNAAGVVNFNKSDLTINFKNQAVISYSTDTFNEAAANDGSIGNSINISISDDAFTGLNASDFIADGKATISNVPASYTATLIKISDSTLTLSLSGAVPLGDHEDADDISNVTVDFNNTAVASARADLVVNETKSDININYADVVLPEITAVTPPADAYYTLGQTLSFTVAYSESVDVVGTPRIVFDINGATVYANYTSGDGTATLIFEYTTIASQQDLNGIVITASTIDLNGGSIKKAGDPINDALISFTVPNTSNIFVDTITPNPISGLTLVAPGNTAVGSESPTISWTNPATSTDNIDHIEIALGTAAGANNTIDYMDIGNVATFQFTGITPDLTQCIGGSPLYFPVVRVHDDANNISSTISNTAGFLFDNVDPTAPSISTVTFDATNTESATIAWTAGTDACGVASYEMSIGQDLDASGTLELGEIGNIQGWTDVGNLTSSNLTGLTLVDNVNYHTAIRTVDVTGRKSTYVVSSRWRANFNYRRDVTIAPATSVTESHVMITLNSSNFTYANAEPDLQDLRFFTTADVALNYWIEYHDSTDETRIWVKIPDTGTSTIVMKYGTVNLSDGQDKSATFSFSSLTDLYVEMQGHQTNKTMNIASYVDSNQINVATSSSGMQTIDEGDVFTFASVEQGVIQATGGLSGRVLDDNPAYEAIIPLSEAVTSFGYPVSRDGNDRYRIYNPNSSSATVTINAFNAGGNSVGTTQTIVVPANSFGYDADVDDSNSGVVFIGSSTLPVIPYYYSRTAGNYDGNVQPAADTMLFGVPSSQGYVSCTQNGTTFTVYRSSNSLVAQNTYACNDGQRINIADSSYSQGLAPAVRIVSNNPIFGTSQADSDGLESAAFMGLSSLDRDYIIPANSEYIVMACPYPSTNIEVFDETGTSIYSNTCNANGNFPGKDKLLATQFSLTRMPPGYRIKSNKPFYVMYEYENQDETSIYGGKSARKYLETPLATTVSGTEY